MPDTGGVAMRTNDETPPYRGERTFSLSQVLVFFRQGETGLRKRAIKQDLKIRLGRAITKSAPGGLPAQELAIRGVLVQLAADLPRHQRRCIVAGVKGFCGPYPWDFSLDFGTVRTPRDIAAV